MNRRSILLVAAVVVAAIGAALVFMYVQGAETRAEDKFDTVEVLVANQQIEAGEPVEDALAGGKIALEAVTLAEVLPGATGDGTAFDGLTALTTVYPGEQLIPEKFGGATKVEAESSLPIPKGKMAISVNLTDPARVAGFVNPGSEVAVFFTGTADAMMTEQQEEIDVTRLLLERVTVLGVGSTTQVTTTTTDETGQQTTEQLPRTILTLALDQAEAERLFLADFNAELSLGLLTADSDVAAGPGVTDPTLFE
jgi:pilus assembly protein CpaB